MQSSNISSTTNLELLNCIKGISSCYHCKSQNLLYTQHLDEVSCLDCGYVLRQALEDFEFLFKDENEGVKDEHEIWEYWLEQ